MKIVVDYDLCEANAVCMDVCPECFRVEEDDTLTVLVESPGEELRGKVEEAVRLCPRQAIVLEGWSPVPVDGTARTRAALSAHPWSVLCTPSACALRSAEG